MLQWEKYTRPPFSNKKAEQLIILLHGMGANGQDLIDLADQWRGFLPNAAFCAPNAPIKNAMIPWGYEWFSIPPHYFPISENILADIKKTMGQALPSLKNFIVQESEYWGVKPCNVALVGFSQGAMMALQLGIYTSLAKAIVSFSGVFLPSEKIILSDLRPEIFLSHGRQDAVIPFYVLEQSIQAIHHLGLKTSSILRPYLGLLSFFK